MSLILIFTCRGGQIPDFLKKSGILQPFPFSLFPFPLTPLFYMAKKSTINFVGRVLDYQKQAPIRGAKVTLTTDDLSLVSYTDLEGIYKFQVSPDKAKDVRGEITVEGSGYKTYNSYLNLSSSRKDLGDIRMGSPHGSQPIYQSNQSNQSNSPTSSSSDAHLLPLIAVIMIALFLLISLSIRSTPRRTPVNRDYRASAITEVAIVSHFVF